MDTYTSRRKTLPQEIVDMVIDNLRTNKSALAHTSLVARSWLARSQKHLFLGIAVTGSDTDRRFAYFAAALRTKPELARYVEHLVLEGRPGVVALPRTEPFVLNASLSPRLLSLILEQLPHLRTLQLHNVSFRGGLYQSSRWRPVCLERLTVMNAGSAMDTRDDVMHLLGLSADVTHLQMASVSQGRVAEEHEWMTRIGVFNGPWPQDAHLRTLQEEIPGDDGKDAGGKRRPVVVGREMTARPTPRSPTANFPSNTDPETSNPVKHLCVTAVKLDDVATNTLLDILESSSSAETLRDVDLQLSTLNDGSRLRSFLTKHGARLEHLALDFAPYLEAAPKGSDPVQRISDAIAMVDAITPGLAACTSLRSFKATTFFGMPHKGRTYHHAPVYALYGALQALPTTVSGITIEFSSDWVYTVESLGVNWAIFERLWGRFEKLKTVTFGMAPDCDWRFTEEDGAFLREAFGELHEKGMLEVEEW